MELKKPRNWYNLYKFFLALSLAFSLQLAAQSAPMDDEDEDEDEEEAAVEEQQINWREERDQFLKEIQQEARDIVAKLVTRDATSNFIVSMIRRGKAYPGVGDFRNLRGVSMPQWQWSVLQNMEKPEKIGNITYNIKKEIEAEVAAEFPESKRENFPKEAQEKYRMYQLGERVEFLLRDGVGTNTEVNGIFSGITAERILVGGRYISRIDIDDETEARFYTEQNQLFIATYIQNENDRYDAIIKGAKADREREKIPPAFHEAGYVPDPSKPGASIKTAKEEYWISRRVLHDRVFNTLTRLATERKIKELTPKRLADRGYVQAPNENNEVEWMPQTVADQIKAEKEAAALNAQQGGEGVPPPTP